MTGRTDTALEIWALVAVNFLGVLLGVVITGLSYWAYRSSAGKSSLRNATVGFGFFTLGVAVEPLYQVGIVRTHVLVSERNVSLQILEASLISLGFLFLFASIYRYGSGRRRHRIAVGGIDDDLLDEPD